MGRPKDEYYWNQVDREEDGRLKCKRCEFKFKGGVSRIKAHIDRLEGKGIRICSTSPKDITSSDHSHQDINVITASQVVESGLEMVGGATTLSAALFEGNEEEYSNGVLTTLQSKLDELRSDLICEEEDIQGQLQLLELRGQKRKKKVDHWLEEIQNMKQRAIDMKDSLNEFGCSNFHVPQGEMYSAEESQKKIQHLTEDIQYHKKWKPLVLTHEYFGRKFEKNVEKLWKLTRDDRVFIIGIYGMGGVGKTFLAAYMQNEIKRNKIFEDVLWVTVSHDFTIVKLQQRIAEIIKVRLCSDDETERSMILASELEKRKNILFILDDVWKYIDLEKVGIPRVNGIKLIITSRLRHVCQQMDCLSVNIIEVSPSDYNDYYLDDDYLDDDYLDDDDLDDDLDEIDSDWKLFLLKLGHYETPLTLSPQVRNIAKSVVRKCGGLPLGISVMARTMKGITSIHWWRHVLNKLDNLEMGVMQEEVLTVLKRSYDNLSEEDVQKSFLYIALLPNFMYKDDVIKKLFDIGLLKVNKSLEEIFDEGNVTVDKLLNHSLLMENDLALSMHDLVRKMALNILKESGSKMMIKCNGDMKKIPDTWEWTIDLEVVSLATNKINEIPQDTSPICPGLSTLFSFENFITHIPECFFTHMNTLTILDLSGNSFLRPLPRSLSNLRSLTSLMINKCSGLTDIPPLGELQSLLRLEISNCLIEVLPEGLENLVNLRWLDLSNNAYLELVPRSFPSNLTNIQYLNLWHCSGGIEVEDVKEMTMLECFKGTFANENILNRYVREILNSANGPQTYLIDHLVDWKHNWRERPPWSWESYFLTFDYRTMSFKDCKKMPHFLPENLIKLLLEYNDHWVYLCDILLSNDISHLEEICIHDSTNLTSLFCSSSSCCLCINIRNLRTLKLSCLQSLTTIFKELPPRGMFSHLKTLDVYKCHRIKILLPSRLVRHLQNLESVTLSHCDSMEQIFALAYDDSDKNDENDDDGDRDGDEDEDNEGEHDDNNKIRLPKLNCLEVKYLPQLKTVCEGVLICNSGLKPFIIDCPKLCEPRIE
ncbi:hypothetical protein VIGAN_04024900 [Vigna angularis var. angularis]|uniref:NB-ARC domain-containing protein n=1 Tax=Vigna angularis var. angularis TaxID=157739 RepID=A0A0S3RRH5_PHAAN|nr:hypothetical protein VIGAN_04024900 [Vigna angularis var. angularis]